MNPKIQSLIAKILLQSPVAPSRINFFQSCFQQSNQSQISSAGKHEFKMQQIYYTKINVLVLHDCCSKQRQKPSTQMNKKINLRLTSAEEMLAQYKSQSREKHDGGAHGPKSPPPPCIHRESRLKIFHPFCKP